MIVQLNPFLRNYGGSNIKIKKEPVKKNDKKKIETKAPEDPKLKPEEMYYTKPPTPLEISSLFSKEEEQHFEKFDVNAIPKYSIDYNEFIKHNHEKVVDLNNNNQYKEPEKSVFESYYEEFGDEDSSVSSDDVSVDKDYKVEDEEEEDEETTSTVSKQSSDTIESDDEDGDEDDDDEKKAEWKLKKAMWKEEKAKKEEEKEKEKAEKEEKEKKQKEKEEKAKKEKKEKEKKEKEEKEKKRKEKKEKAKAEKEKAEKEKKEKEEKNEKNEKEEAKEENEKKQKEEAKKEKKEKEKKQKEMEAKEAKEKKEKAEKKAKEKKEKEAKEKKEKAEKEAKEKEEKAEKEAKEKEEKAKKDKEMVERNREIAEKLKNLPKVINSLQNLEKISDERHNAFQLFTNKLMTKSEFQKIDNKMKEASENHQKVEAEQKEEIEKQYNVRDWMIKMRKIYANATEDIGGITKNLTNDFIKIIKVGGCIENNYNDYSECAMHPFLDHLYKELFQVELTLSRITCDFVNETETNSNTVSETTISVPINNEDEPSVQVHFDKYLNDEADTLFSIKDNKKLEEYFENNLLYNDEFCNIIKNYHNNKKTMFNKLKSFGKEMKLESEYDNIIELMENPKDRLGAMHFQQPRKLKTGDYIHIRFINMSDFDWDTMQARFSPNETLDYTEPIDIVQEDTGETITYCPIAVAMYHRHAHYTAMLNIKNEWWHINDTEITKGHSSRDRTRPDGAIYMRKEKYDVFKNTELKKLKGIENMGHTLCWWSTTIQMLFNVPEIWNTSV